ncbi:MAG: hypothetical protein LRY55_00615, partial [Leadbetterella sp.]|nr:hypothetical protein [Leadbetterella sp.]
MVPMAFAAQSGIPSEKINVCGGAVA